MLLIVRKANLLLILYSIIFEVNTWFNIKKNQGIIFNSDKFNICVHEKLENEGCSFVKYLNSY